MRAFKTFLTVIGAVTVLVLAANTVAFAATGGKFILGHKNKAGNVTTLKRTTSGSALKLRTTSSSAAPLIVNGAGKVANLNADKVDGYDSSTMVNQTTVYQKSIDLLVAGTVFSLVTGTVPAGKYMVTGSAWIYGPTAGTGVECSILGSTNDGQWAFLPINPNGYYTPNLSGLLTLPTAQPVTFECNGPSFTYNTYFGAPLQLTLTKVAQAISGAATRVAPSSSRVGPAQR